MPWLIEHIGEYVSTADIAHQVGRDTGQVESILADLESPESPIMLAVNDDYPRKNVLIMKKGWADV